MENVYRQRGYNVQILQFSEGTEMGVLVQIQNDELDWKRDIVRTVSGGKLAVNVRLLPKEQDLLVEIGNGKWLERHFQAY